METQSRSPRTAGMSARDYAILKPVTNVVAIHVVAYYERTPENIGEIVTKCIASLRGLVGDRRVGVAALFDSNCPIRWREFDKELEHARLVTSDVANGLLHDVPAGHVRSIYVDHYSGKHAPGRTTHARPRWELCYKVLDATSTVSESSLPNQYVLDISVDVSYFVKQTRVDTMACIRALWSILDSCGGVVQGLTDILPADEACGGQYFRACGTPEGAGWHRTLEHGRWLWAGAERLTRVRGVYWGLYLGKPLVARMGSLDEFEASFSKAGTSSHVIHPQSVARHASGAVFVALSDDPLELRTTSFYDPSNVYNAATWLESFLRSRTLIW